MQGFFRNIIFTIIHGISSMINTILNLMRKLLGLDEIEGFNGKDPIIGLITKQEVIYAFIAVVLLGFVLSFVFAIIRIIKNNLSERDDDGAVSKSKAVRGVFATAINIVIIPVFALSLVLAIAAIAQSIDIATGGGGDVDYGTEIVFSVVDKEDLAPTGRKYYNGEKQVWITVQVGEETRREQLKGMDAVKWRFSGRTYYSGEFSETAEHGGNNFNELKDLVNQDAYFSNALVVLLGGAVMLVALGMSTIVVAQRLFYCVFLFIISPAIAATRPLDDGARWRKWTEVFLSKLMGSFAIIIGINVFFLLSKYLVSLTFFIDGLANGIAKLIIYAGGVLAATSAGQLVAQLIGADAGMAERDAAAHNFRNVGLGMGVAAKGMRVASAGASKVGDFFAGKKSNPALAAMGAGTGGTGAAMAGTQSMAARLGAVMSGRQGAGKQMLGSMASGVKNSRVGRIVGGAGALVGGMLAVPVRAAKGVSGAVSKRKRDIVAAGGRKKYAAQQAERKTRLNAFNSVAKKLDPSRASLGSRLFERASNRFKRSDNEKTDDKK